MKPNNKPIEYFPNQKGSEFLYLAVVGVLAITVSLFLPFITVSVPLGGDSSINGLTYTPLQALFIIGTIILGIGSIFKYKSAQFKEDLSFARIMAIITVILGVIGIGVYYYSFNLIIKELQRNPKYTIDISSFVHLGIGFYGIILGVGLIAFGTFLIGSNFYKLSSKYTQSYPSFGYSGVSHNYPVQTNQFQNINKYGYNQQFSPQYPQRLNAICESCGEAVTQKVSFCPTCGASMGKLRDFCVNCGTKFLENSGFCINCGQKRL